MAGVLQAIRTLLLVPTVVLLCAATGAHADERHDHSHAGVSGQPDAPLAGTPFPTDLDALPDALPATMVRLADGDAFDLTAGYVRKTVGNRVLRMLAYNRSVPGPFIRVERDSTVTIRFRNETDLVQTVHSHGIRIDNRYDGVPGVTQAAVKPGESFDYIVHFPDAGVFWYHPHTREDYGQELGLYGNYLVDAPDPDYWSPVNREIPLVIDDVLIEDDRIATFYREFTNFALLGRFGSEFLVNGETDYELDVERGEVVRFFITNVSNVRTYNLSLPGVRKKLVGGDLGRLEHEAFVDSLLISPAERLVVEAHFPTPGTYELTHTQPDGAIRLATVRVAAEPRVATSHAAAFARARHNEAVTDEFDLLRHWLDAEPDKRLLLTIDLADAEVDHSMHTHSAAEHTEHTGHDHGEHVAAATALPAEYTPLTPTAAVLKTLQWDDPSQSDRTHRTPEIRWQLVDQETGKVSMDIDDWTFTEGDRVKIRLRNDPDADHVMQHPMHLHGQQFAVLAVDGLPNANMVWKDTVLVAPGQDVDILVQMTNPGVWMAHCHIAEHLHAGMALLFRVEDESGHAPGDAYRSGSHSEHRH